MQEDEKNFHDLQIELLTEKIKSVKSSIHVLEQELCMLQEEHAWHVLVKAGRIPCRSGIEASEQYRKERRVRKEEVEKRERENWSKCKNVPKRFKGDKKKPRNSGKKFGLEKWLTNRQAREKEKYKGKGEI